MPRSACDAELMLPVPEHKHIQLESCSKKNIERESANKNELDTVKPTKENQFTNKLIEPILAYSKSFPFARARRVACTLNQ